MQRAAVYILEPGKVEIRQEEFEPASGQDLLVATVRSAVSAGTELLFYRGQIPSGMSVDSTIDSLQDHAEYPLKYGYAAVGRVVEVQRKEDKQWLDRIVFSFQPHQSSFWAPPDALIPLPDGLHPEQAVFLPNMETAVNFLHDGRPIVGERVLVIGQGVVGLLTTALLANHPLATLVTLDTLPNRRDISVAWGADLSLDPDNSGMVKTALADPLGDVEMDGADLTYELSSNPKALSTAIQHTGFSGRVVIGSWYGIKRSPLDLGGRFHRSRMKLISSQVSTLAPALTGRWSKGRRMKTVITLIQELGPERLISHRFPVQRAADAYRLLDQASDDVLLVVFTYD